MSRRSRRFRATVDVPELGTVEVRGLSPDAFATLPFDAPPPEEVAASEYAHPISLAIIASCCVRPRLSEEQILALPPTSRELLGLAIVRAHPAMRGQLSGGT